MGTTRLPSVMLTPSLITDMRHESNRVTDEPGFRSLCLWQLSAPPTLEQTLPAALYRICALAAQDYFRFFEPGFMKCSSAVIPHSLRRLFEHFRLSTLESSAARTQTPDLGAQCHLLVLAARLYDSALGYLFIKFVIPSEEHASKH